MIDDYCMEQSDRIFELEEQLRITEKALELACRDTSCDYCPFADKCDSWAGIVEDGDVCDKMLHKWYIEQAKEMMKSE